MLTFDQAIGASVALMFIAQAYRIARAPLVAAFEYSFLVFAAFWAWVLWGTSINTQGVIGITIVIVSGTIFSLLKQPLD